MINIASSFLQLGLEIMLTGREMELQGELSVQHLAGHELLKFGVSSPGIIRIRIFKKYNISSRSL